MEQRPDQEDFLENLLKNLTDSIYFKDLKSKFVMVNQTCAERHGKESPSMLVGKSDFDTFAREHAEHTYADEQRIIATGEPLIGTEEKETREDGHVSWLSTTKMPLKNAEGEIIGTFGISRDITEHKEAELRTRQYADEIRGIKEEMEEEVRMAGELQKNFCPSAYPVFPEGALPEESCIEFLHRFNLTRQVTGDYCAITRLSETEAGIFLCDVSGIGLRAALGTAFVRGVMQEVASKALDPGGYLSRMNALLMPVIHHDDILLDASACYLVINVQTGLVRMANANHSLPIHFHNGTLAQWLGNAEACCGPSLGAEADVEYPTTEFKINPDDAVVLFTDGLFSLKNNAGDAYGKKRLLDSAHSFSGEPLEDIFQGLEDDALAFSSDGKCSDDVCMVGFHLKSLLA